MEGNTEMTSAGKGKKGGISLSFALGAVIVAIIALAGGILSGKVRRKQVREQVHPTLTAENTAGLLTEDNLLKLFGENWAHIRHMEYYRMWCVNIYAVIVAALVHALGSGNIESYLGYVAAFLVLFTILNLLITLKIEAVIENFVRANEAIVAELKVTESIAPIRTRERPWDVIRFQWIFTAFYCLVLAGIVVLVVLHYRTMLGL